jgi:pilus assembly protein FimV
MVEEPADEAAATTPQPVAAPQPAPTPQPQPARQAPADEGMGSWLYIAGGAIIALLAGLFFWRRKREEDAEILRPTATQAQPVSRSTAFEGVQLKDQQLEVEAAPAEEPAAAAAPEPVEEPAVAEAKEEGLGSGRGYGEERHDKYAEDADTGDALAEADIYIAYGRHSQAIDLLKTAIGNEPENAAYRLKLIELYVDQGERDEAAGQLTELRSRGDADAIARAEAIMSGGTGAGAVTETPTAPEPVAEKPVPTVGAPSGAGSLASEEPEAESLESDFSGLEIEEGDSGEEVADELDLSDDFGSNGEEMVFAAEGNQMSTKLDLARAYMDMGDEDGARQILEEVITEGSEEQQDEARQLLARIG